MPTKKQLVADRLNLSDADIASQVNALSVHKTDSQRWTSAGLAKRIGRVAVGTLDEILKQSVGCEWIRLLLAGGGVDFSDAETQEAIEDLRGAIGDDMANSLKAIGRWSVSPWSEAGGESPATEAEIATLRAEILASQAVAAVQAKWASVQNEIVNPMIPLGATWAEIKAAIAEVE